ncbi:MAG: tetratricopeptide repeat protein, partial [Chloroflexales bacterium]|nr:tetratricopeptide repeat protein [Chloroflexales bacterium]
GPSGPLIGRSAELAQIAARLADPACRQLTLVGPGGNGKTWLAQASAAQLAARFADGAAVVNLAAVESAALLPSAIAAALDIPLDGGRDPQTALLHALTPRHMLLVLDNIEHLLDGANLLRDLLHQAPGVRLLVTSRRRLGITVEWLFAVPGLPYPPYDPRYQEEDDPRFRKALPAAAELTTYGAVELFRQRAVQLLPQFALTPSTVPFVLQICGLVEGVPLAIELAASWVRILSCKEIVLAITRGIDALTTTLHDVTSHHRSMRAVFDHSWQLLEPSARSALSCLAVFRGSFTLKAAEAVLATTAPQGALFVLHPLLDASLLRHRADEHYDLHELLRQYAEERLVDSSVAPQAFSRHAQYYLGWVGTQAARLTGIEQQEALRDVGSAIDNLRAAWTWAAEYNDTRALAQALEALWLWYDRRNLFREGYERFAYAVRCLTTQPSHAAPELVGALLVRQGHFCERIGKYAEGEELLARSLQLLDAAEPSLRALALTTRGRIAERSGTYAQAHALHQQSLLLYQEASDQRGMASALHNLGSALEYMGAYQEAKDATGAALDLMRALGDRRAQALTLNMHGIVVEMLGEYAKAQQCYVDARAIFAALNDQWGVAIVNGNLGDVAATLGDEAAAQGYYAGALQAARVHWDVPLLVSFLVKTADSLARSEQREMALEVLALPLAYTATEHKFQQQAQALRDQLAAGLEAPAFDAAIARGAANTLEETVATALALLLPQRSVAA